VISFIVNQNTSRRNHPDENGKLLEVEFKRWEYIDMIPGVYLLRWLHVEKGNENFGLFSRVLAGYSSASHTITGASVI
jgi:hypothetical protein